MKVINIKSNSFISHLQKIIHSSRVFLEFTREYELPSTVNGVLVYCDEDDKCGFQVAGQYERPTEYLQAFLDIIRVEYDPLPLGTFQLNSNLEFLYNSIPQDEFSLGYLSIVSQNNQEFRSFWIESVSPYLSECGYEKAKIKVLIAIVTTGEDQHSYHLISEVQNVLGGGFTVDEVVNGYAKAVSNDGDVSFKTSSNVFSGFCYDPALEKKMRLSLWMFIESKTHTH